MHGNLRTDSVRVVEVLEVRRRIWEFTHQPM